MMDAGLGVYEAEACELAVRMFQLVVQGRALAEILARIRVKSASVWSMPGWTKAKT